MKNLITKFFPALFCLSIFLALPVAAMDMDHGAMDHGSTTMNDDSSGMDMDGGLIMLHNDVQGSIKASAHMRDVSKAMAEMGMKATHHFMVMFVDQSSNKTLDTGIVAVKITAPSGVKTKAIKLMAMSGSFGADVTLDETGEYLFEVGSKLSDGKKRKFHFKYMMM
ncbi:MAG: hypothetical protein KQH63_18535 [Desulfobulbaceae bacterium]|nr:hypothetical protein [Desulfobulbaceae bacterium]